jgi:hypothetical protein
MIPPRLDEGSEREALTEAQIEELYTLACHDWNSATSEYPSVGVFLARRIFAALSTGRLGGEAEGGEYFLQDTRSYVGNCPMWWGGSGGYTSRIDKARRYTFDEAMRQHECRDTDVPWPCSEIEPLKRPTIDVQEMPRSIKQQRTAMRSARTKRANGAPAAKPQGDSNA